MDARTKLDEKTSISEERKSGIITISVTDHSPQRAAALANAYVDELNSRASELSTSSAHRERVFLEERLKVAKQDLDDASNQLAQFSSKHNTLDIQQEGKAMLDPARIPERKSFPPRLVIMFLGTFLVFALSTVWVLGSARWEEVDPQDPRKVLAQEVAGALKAQLPWASRNGTGAVFGEKDSVS